MYYLTVLLSSQKQKVKCLQANCGLSILLPPLLVDKVTHKLMHHSPHQKEPDFSLLPLQFSSKLPLKYSSNTDRVYPLRIWDNITTLQNSLKNHFGLCGVLSKANSVYSTWLGMADLCEVLEKTFMSS